MTGGGSEWVKIGTILLSTDSNNFGCLASDSAILIEEVGLSANFIVLIFSMAAIIPRPEPEAGLSTEGGLLIVWSDTGEGPNDGEVAGAGDGPDDGVGDGMGELL